MPRKSREYREQVDELAHAVRVILANGGNPPSRWGCDVAFNALDDVKRLRLRRALKDLEDSGNVDMECE